MTWDELKWMRWGPGLRDCLPGIDKTGSADLDAVRRCIEIGNAAKDEYAVIERRAIRDDGPPPS